MAENLANVNKGLHNVEYEVVGVKPLKISQILSTCLHSASLASNGTVVYTEFQIRSKWNCSIYTYSH
jgi:hypothetical protein